MILLMRLQVVVITKSVIFVDQDVSHCHQPGCLIYRSRGRDTSFTVTGVGVGFFRFPSSRHCNPAVVIAPRIILIIMNESGRKMPK